MGTISCCFHWCYVQETSFFIVLMLFYLECKKGMKWFWYANCKLVRVTMSFKIFDSLYRGRSLDSYGPLKLIIGVVYFEWKILSEASYEELYGRDKQRQLSSMKDYLKKGNDLKKYAAVKKSEADIKVNMWNARSEMLLVQEVNTFDDEIKSRKSDISKHLQQLENP